MRPQLLEWAAVIAPSTLSRAKHPRDAVTWRRWVRPALLGLAVLVAYRYSLTTLARGLGTDTPLAYLGLVPLVAIALAFLGGRPTEEPTPTPGDVAAGAALLAVAFTLGRTPLTWAFRLDLLALPVFVTGAVVGLYGRSVARRRRAALAFLALAWPFPYVVVIVRFLTGFTTVTAHAVRLGVGVLHVAHPVSSATGATFLVEHHPAFRIDVATSCSGVASALGFLFVGTACVLVVEGSRRRKAAWMATGFVAAWLLNVGRILLLLTVGRLFGLHIAMDWLHPYLGVVTFNVALVAMLLLLRRFGLRLSDAESRPGARDPSITPARPGTAAAVLLVLAAVAIGQANTGLRALDLASASRLPTHASISTLRTAGVWQLGATQSIGWAARFFGGGASWHRAVATRPGDAAALQVDVLATEDRAGLAAFGIEAFFRIDGRRSTEMHRLELLPGVPGQTIGGPDAVRAIWWVETIRSGSSTRYEQIVVSAPTGTAREVDVLDLARSLLTGRR